MLSAHADELAKVRAAQSRKEVLLITCERRNREVEKLAEKARKAFEQAASEQGKSFDAATAAHRRAAVAFEAAFMEEQSKMKALRAEVVRPGSEGLTKRIALAMKATREQVPFDGHVLGRVRVQDAYAAQRHGEQLLRIHPEQDRGGFYR